MGSSAGFDPVLEPLALNADWDEPFEAYLDESTPEPLTDYLIEVSLKLRPAAGQAAEASVDFSTDDATVVITDASQGQFQMAVPKATMEDLTVGRYDLQIRFAPPGGGTKDFYHGQRQLVAGAGA